MYEDGDEESGGVGSRTPSIHSADWEAATPSRCAPVLQLAPRQAAPPLCSTALHTGSCDGVLTTAAPCTAWQANDRCDARKES